MDSGVAKPGIKFDHGKPRPGLLPAVALLEVSKVMAFGAKKYGDNNWQGLSDFQARYYDALQRHMLAWQMGEKLDQESGLPHLAHAGCCVLFMLWKELTG